MSAGRATTFAARVAEGMARRGHTLRSFCRAVELDPSFFSKVLAGKRSPPSEEAVLRRIAAELELDAAGLIVAAGRIPAEWGGLAEDSELFARVHGMASSGGGQAAAAKPHRRPPLPSPPAPRRSQPIPSRPLADELL